jgi:hypothetical protein
MAGRGPLNYTTTIDPSKTAGECIAILVQHGASHVGMEMEEKIPTGISFQIQTRWGRRGYALPINVDGTYQALLQARRRGHIPPRYADRDQARRVAWRVLKDWLEVQIAMIEAGMFALEEVMLPWQMVEPGKTVFMLADEEQLASMPALPAGDPA